MYQLETEKNSKQKMSSSLKVAVLFLPGFAVME
jgi:hypothetical protein